MRLTNTHLQSFLTAPIIFQEMQTGFQISLMTVYPHEKTGEVLPIEDKFCSTITDAQSAFTVNGQYLVIFCTEAA